MGKKKQKRRGILTCVWLAYDKEGHNHKMEKLGFGLDDESTTCDQKQTNPQESRNQSIQRCIKCLIHACRDANCRHPSCQRMKRVVQHAKGCKQKTTDCPLCKQLLALCRHHAKKCQEAKCPVPYCINIRNKIKHQQLQQRLQKAQILKRRIATMQNRGMSGAVLQTNPGNSNSSSQPSPGAHHCAHKLFNKCKLLLRGKQHHTWLLPLLIMEKVIQSQSMAKGSPPTANSGLMASTQQMQTQMQKPMSQMMSGVPNRMLNMGNVTCWEGPGYAQNPQPHQNPQPQSAPQMGIRQPTQLMGGPGNMPNSIGNSAMGPPPQVMPNPGPSLGGMQRPTQAWQQLLQTLTL